MADAVDSSGDFVASGLAALGIEVDDVERAVIEATHQVFWGPIVELLGLDTAGVEPEPETDLARAP